jgi:hypothetical protein
MAVSKRGKENFRNQTGEDAKKYIDLEERYQDALKVTSSMIGGLQKTVEDYTDAHVNNNETAKRYQAIAKGIASSLTDTKSIQTAISEIETTRRQLQMDMSEVSQEFYNGLMETLDSQEKILKVQEKQLQVTGMLDSAQKALTDSTTDFLDGIKTSLDEIPFLGKALGGLASGPINNLKSKITDAGKTFVSDFSMRLGEGQSMMQALGGAGKGAMSSLAAAINPVTIGLVAVAAALALGFMRFKQIDDAAKSFRESTGLLNSQTQQMVGNIQSISTQYAGLGASADDVAQSAGEFVNAFDGLEQPAKSTLESMVVLNKNFGVGASEAAKVNKVMQNMGGLTETQAQYLTNSVAEMSKLAGVAPQKVMKDIADNSGDALKYFRGQPALLAKSAVSLAAMGSSLESAAKSSEALLDFESSIANELEASALLGADINFEKARAAAFAGDQYGQEKAIMEQMMQLGDISKMDVYSKEALAKATGKSVEELINMQRIQEKFPNLDETRLAAAHALMDAGKEIKDINEQDLATQTAKMAKDKEMQGRLENMTNEIMAFGTEIMDFLMPVAEIVMGLLVGFFKPMMAIVSNIFEHIKQAFAPIADMLGPSTSLFSIFEEIGKVIGFIVGLVQYPLVFATEMIIGYWGSVIDIISGIVKIFKGDFMGGLAQIGDGIIGLIFTPFIAGFNTVMDYLEGFFTIFESLGAWMHEYLIDPLSNFFGGVGNVLSSVASFFGGGAATPAAESTESVDDGVMQNGNVISTDPADFLIASKNPSALAGQIGGGDGGGTAALVSSLIAEMQGMRADLAAGKIAVNIDGQKMNAKIAANAVRNPIS